LTYEASTLFFRRLQVNRSTWVLLFSGLLLFIAGCGEGVLDPGEVALPLTGTYTLESRSTVVSDSVVAHLEPPTVRGFLTLARNGRFGLLDTTETTSGTQVFVETGRWSVLGDELYIETDSARSAIEKFTYDGFRLTRTLSDNIDQPLISVVDVWRRR
jgi:hypothetical protein